MRIVVGLNIRFADLYSLPETHLDKVQNLQPLSPLLPHFLLCKTVVREVFLPARLCRALGTRRNLLPQLPDAPVDLRFGNGWAGLQTILMQHESPVDQAFRRMNARV